MVAAQVSGQHMSWVRLQAGASQQACYRPAGVRPPAGRYSACPPGLVIQEPDALGTDDVPRPVNGAGHPQRARRIIRQIIHDM